jgi:hypothetical protein
MRGVTPAFRAAAAAASRLACGEDGACVGEAGRVGDGRAGADDAGVVAGNIGNEKRDDSSRMGRRSEPPALDGGEVLPHRVHLPDVGAGFEKSAVHHLLVGKGQAFGR